MWKVILKPFLNWNLQESLYEAFAQTVWARPDRRSVVWTGPCSEFKLEKRRWTSRSRRITIRISWRLWWKADWKEWFKSELDGPFEPVNVSRRPYLVKTFEIWTETGVTTVSINEVRLAIENGIENSKIIFNGNGKTKIELLKAINYGVIINVDSKFDYDNLLEAKGNVLK